MLCAKSLQSRPTLCDAMGSFVRGIFQARILEWVAMPSSRGSSRPRDPARNPHLLHQHWQAGSSPPAPWEAPSFIRTAEHLVFQLCVYTVVISWEILNTCTLFRCLLFLFLFFFLVFLKSFLNLLQYCFWFWLFGCEAYGIF